MSARTPLDLTTYTSEHDNLSATEIDTHNTRHRTLHTRFFEHCPAYGIQTNTFDSQSETSATKYAELSTFENVNTNSVPDQPHPSRQALRESNSPSSRVARDAGGGGSPSRRSTSGSTGPNRGPVTSIIVYFLLLIRDILTFLIRGGLSAMMFSMDQILRALLLVTEVLVGSTASRIVGYPVRIVMWVYQLLLWVVYTMVELLLYLPTPVRTLVVLLAYITILILALLFMPSPARNLVTGLFTSLRNYVRFYKTVYRMARELDYNIAGPKNKS